MMDADIFTQTGNRKRIYSLASWTVVYRATGWWFRKTDSNQDWRGPLSSESSVTLNIARELRKELKKRDGLAA